MSESKITAKCECGSVFRIGAKYAGKRVACPNCGNPMSLPPTTAKRSVRGSRNQPNDDRLPAYKSSNGRTTSGRKTKSGWSTATIVLTVIGGGVFLVFAACAGLAYVGFGKLKDATVYEGQPEFGDPEGLFPIEKFPLPSFAGTERVKASTIGTADVYKVRISPEDEMAAGFEMDLRIYMPVGSHEPGSLPCVFVAPAGTNLMVGNRLDDGDYHDETMPYAEAGMIAVSYSLDGPCNLETVQDQQLRDAYLRFRAACGGVVNARNALEYILAKVPEANPSRLYCAGHSSAGNVSLLFAAHEPRIRACVAYCPAADVEAELAEIINTPGSNLLLPKIDEFLKQSNPMTHAAKFGCPVYLFHARDDSNTPFINTERLAMEMQKHQVNVTFVPVDSGGHYASMIEAIPNAIEWLQGQK